jgi:hypothetical protein
MEKTGNANTLLELVCAQLTKPHSVKQLLLYLRFTYKGLPLH